MSSLDFLGLIGTLASIALWFLIPVLCWVLYLRVAKIVRLAEENQDKLNTVERKLQRIESRLNSMLDNEQKLS